MTDKDDKWTGFIEQKGRAVSHVKIKIKLCYMYVVSMCETQNYNARLRHGATKCVRRLMKCLSSSPWKCFEKVKIYEPFPPL